MKPEEINQLKQTRATAQAKAILVSRRFKLIKKAYHCLEAKYDSAMREYNKLDREYALALHDEKTKKLKIRKSGKAYNANKRTAAKALKALGSLSKELRDKIIKDAQNGLF